MTGCILLGEDRGGEINLNIDDAIAPDLIGVDVAGGANAHDTALARRRPPGMVALDNLSASDDRDGRVFVGVAAYPHAGRVHDV